MATGTAGNEAIIAPLNDTVIVAATTEVPTKKLSFVDLPAETQQEIISHCSQSDLICVALVSKYFHELASVQLYRNFHIIFPDDDDVNFDSPIDGLAGGLDTFTTSEYNYAKHLKDLSMDTLSSGPKGESSYQSYLYSASCGKFLNTLLYLTLKKAKSLEVFRWNIRVELSRPVYQELHQIASLKKLHIRMQAGESYYNPPPPLPVSMEVHMPPGPSNHWTEVPPPPPLGGPLNVIPLPPPGISPIPSGPPPALLPPSKLLFKSRLGKRGLPNRDPSTLSGFKNLKSLCVLDIDNLDIVGELKTCVRNSSSTLTELQLSLSDALATQARKPPPESDPDDSDVDDEFQVVPVSQNNNYDASGPAKAFRAQEERRLQEGVLNRIFDIEPALKKVHTQVKSEEFAIGQDKGKEPEGSLATDPRQAFLTSITSVSTRLTALINGSRDFSAGQQEILDTIEKAARRYMDSFDATTQSNPPSNPADGSKSTTVNDNKEQPSPEPVVAKETASGATNGKEEAIQAPSQLVDTDGSTADVVPGSANQPASSSAFKPSKEKGDMSPEDIDIAHVDMPEDVSDDSDDQQLVEAKEKASAEPTADAATPDATIASTSPSATQATDVASLCSPIDKAIAKLETYKVNFNTLLNELNSFQGQASVLGNKIRDMKTGAAAMDPTQIRDAEAQVQKFSRCISEVQNQIMLMESEIDDVERQLPTMRAAASGESTQQNMSDYIRQTRGLSLTTLSIHLIPVKASVLSRAVNLACLKQLTLLNVGNQAPIWTLLAKENKIRPLALRSIFTDNVSNAFLTCVSQLEELHELFMLERNVKFKPDSFAPRTTVTMDQIRRLVLKKHIGTLKRLMIKDESPGPNWDANEKTMILICMRGRQLEELAVSMNIHAVHAFVQYISGLVNLRAINILRFRNNDTCIWVMRELLRFIVDNLSHHPELKLEWIAMEDDHVDRVVRPADMPDEASAEKPKKNSKSKGKGTGIVGLTGPGNDAFPILPVDGLESESESEDDVFDSGARLRFKTVGGMQFYDVWGVKIFDKEIRSGKL